MRMVVALAGLLAAQPVLAQPGAEPPGAGPSGQTATARCEVHLLRAPEDARAKIEARLRHETRCATSLVVRLVPTTGGIYLLAHTPTGRTYEMVVPDADTAADLIGRWVQRREDVPPVLGPWDDPPAGQGAIDAVSPYTAGPGTSGATSPGASANANAKSGGAAATTSALSAAAVPSERPPGEPAASARAGTWVSASAIAGPGVAGGRVAIDLWSRGGWSAGVGLAISDMTLTFDDPGPATFDFLDVRAVVTAAHTLGRGPWKLRGEAAVGVVRTQLDAEIPYLAPSPVEYTGTHPIGELTVQVIRTFGRDHRWSVTGGPMLTVYAQKYEIDAASQMARAHRDLDVSFVGGIRRRL